MIFLAVAN